MDTFSHLAWLYALKIKAIIMAYTRKLSTLATQGISTHMLGRLDQMVQAGLLHSPQQGRANGAVRWAVEALVVITFSEE